MCEWLLASDCQVREDTEADAGNTARQLAAEHMRLRTATERARQLTKVRASCFGNDEDNV